MMENHFNKMLNSLIEICIVVGMDQDTGLVSSSSSEPVRRNASRGNSIDPRLFSTMFETSVLAAISGQTASFPHTPYEVDGYPFYPNDSILCSPLKGGTRRRRGSLKPGRLKPAAELPLAQDVINSLPPLCFPDGGFVSKKRKPVFCHSLVLTDIEGNRTYCSCLTFHREFFIKESKDEGTPGKYELFFMDEKADEEALQESSRAVCYVPTCFCLISKWPYFNLMKDSLSSLLPQVITSDARSFRLALMRFVSQLAMVPVPPPGSLGMEFTLCGVKHLVRPAEDPETRIIDMELHYPFLYFSLDDILLLIGCILNQQRIVFMSSSYSLLTPIIESFFTFIQPFTWSWTYVPILPSSLLDLVEAPGAFIMGCHAQHKTQIKRVIAQMDELSSIVMADIDEGTVTIHPKARIPPLPTYVTDMYKFRMKSAHLNFDRLLLQRQTFFNLEELKQEREMFMRKFQQLVLASTLEMMLRMFSDMKTFIVQQEDLFFDMDAFIESKPSDDQEFYREVCKSHAFSTFLYDLMHDPEKTDYFTHMAQRTRIAPKAGPLRKRSSSSVPVPIISEEFFVSPQANLSIYVLPPFPHEGIFTGSFYGDYLKSLDEKISDLMNKSSNLVANYLYLRGMLRAACGQNIKAVDDFFLVSSKNVQIFPTKTLQEILCKLSDAELVELRTKQFSRKAEHLRLQAIEKVDFRRDRKEVVTSAIPSTPLVLSEFVKHVSRLQIANSHDAGERLFQALTTSSKMEEVDPETFATFYEAFTEASSKARSVSLRKVLLGENEYVLMISQLIKTNRGMGFLVLTINKLLFMENGTQDCHTVVNIKDIKDVDAITCSNAMFSRGITAIKITSNCQPLMPFVASVKEETDFWRKCLREIQVGYKMAHGWKDPAIIGHAAQNVIMADALWQSDYPEQTVARVLYYSRQNDSKNQLSDHTRKSLVKRLSPSPQDMEKTTVEALLYLPGSNDIGPKVWCAMGSSQSGVIVVIDAVAWEYETHMRHAKELASCLLAVGQNQVWAGSLDNTIYVINTCTGKADQQLLAHRESLSHMTETQDKQGKTTVWSASSNGQIVGWDPVTLTPKQELQVQLGKRDEKTLYWFCAVGGTFWCATRSSVYVVNYVRDNEASKVLTPKKDQPMSIDCMCAVSDTRVWTGCDRSALIVIWNTDTYDNEHRALCKCRKCTLCKCGGFTNMIRVDQQVWVGSKIGAIYVMNSKTAKVDMELSLHEDRIRAMCITDYGLIVTGPGSRDGRIAVWKSYLAVDYPEQKMATEVKPGDTSICEDDGFEVVCQKEKVQFDLDRNEICFIKDAAN